MLAITRKVDNLGRVVIPMEIRKVLNLKTDDLMLIKLNARRQIFIEIFEKGDEENDG